VHQARTDRRRRKFRRTERLQGRRTDREPKQFAVDTDLALCLQTTLRDRLEKLSNKAHMVRSRLSQLMCYLDGTRRAAPPVVMGEEGDDIDFLLTEILALESILARSYRPVSEVAPAAAASMLSG
jgi:hypothetical protein